MRRSVDDSCIDTITPVLGRQVTQTTV